MTKEKTVHASTNGLFVTRRFSLNYKALTRHASLLALAIGLAACQSTQDSTNASVETPSSKTTPQTSPQTTPIPLPPSQAELAQAPFDQVKQQQAPLAIELPQNYRMRIQQSCYCPVELLGPFDIEVRGGKGVSITRVEDQQSLPPRVIGNEIPTLQTVHEHLARANQQKVFRKEVTWLEEPLVPARVFIDFSAQIADEEVDITISQFERLPE